MECLLRAGYHAVPSKPSCRREGHSQGDSERKLSGLRVGHPTQSADVGSWLSEEGDTSLLSLDYFFREVDIKAPKRVSPKC